MNGDRPPVFHPSGSTPPIVLVHGLGASRNAWETIMPGLVRRGAEVHALDLLGHGEGPHPRRPEDYHIEQMYDHLRHEVEALGLAAPPLLIGHSLGGFLSLAHALRFPQDVRALVLINPLYQLSQLHPRIGRCIPLVPLASFLLSIMPEALARKGVQFRFRRQNGCCQESRRQLARDLKRASPLALHVLPTIPDLPLRLDELSQPALVVWGRRDHALEPGSFAELRRAMAYAVSREIPQAGHTPHLTHPGAIERLIRSFLQSVSQAQASSPRQAL